MEKRVYREKDKETLKKEYEHKELEPEERERESLKGVILKRKDLETWRKKQNLDADRQK